MDDRGLDASRESELLRQLVAAGQELMTSESPQLRMLGLRVDALSRSVLDSVVVESDQAGPSPVP